MNEEKQKEQQAKGNTFLLGIVVGVFIALLFTTKRGRIIFKELAEKGVNAISELERVLRDKENGIIDTQALLSEGTNDFQPARAEDAASIVDEPQTIKPTPAKPVEVKSKHDAKAAKSESDHAPIEDDALANAPLLEEDEDDGLEALETDDAETLEETETETTTLKPESDEQPKKRLFRGLRRKK